MNVLIIDSGVVSHKGLSHVTVYPSGFRDQNQFADIEDSTGHGTAVAELIAKNHSDLDLYILKLFDHEFECTLDDLIEALEYVSENNKYAVINMSFGITSLDDSKKISDLELLCQKIVQQGSILFSGFDNDGLISYPAFFPSVIGVDVSSKARTRTEYEYYENSCINLCGFGANQRVAWTKPEYTIIGGSSFACANITNICIAMLKEGVPADSIMKEFSQNAVYKRDFGTYSVLQKPPEWLERSNAILLPFNKEVHSLLAFESLLTVHITGIFDSKYMARIGLNTSDLLTYHTGQDHTICGIDTIDWASDTFDVVIAGHLGELSWRSKNNTLEELIRKCCAHRKKLYAFDSLHPYRQLIQELGGQAQDFYSPGISKDNVPKGRNGKLHEIVSPVLAVIGTSSQQGKYTLQLSLKERLTNRGYQVGQIGTEPSAYCFGMDFVFPYGYESTVETDGFETILLLNDMLHQLDRKNVDISLVGTQSNTVAYSNVNLIQLPLHQYEFLLGTNPDAFVMMVNPHDELEYILRTMQATEASFDSSCIAIVLYPIEKRQVLGELFRPVPVMNTPRYREVKEIIQRAVSVPVLDMNQALSENTLVELIEEFFVS